MCRSEFSATQECTWVVSTVYYWLCEVLIITTIITMVVSYTTTRRNLHTNALLSFSHCSVLILIKDLFYIFQCATLKDQRGQGTDVTTTPGCSKTTHALSISRDSVL